MFATPNCTAGVLSSTSSLVQVERGSIWQTSEKLGTTVSGTLVFLLFGAARYSSQPAGHPFRFEIFVTTASSRFKAILCQMQPRTLKIENAATLILVGLLWRDEAMN